MGNLFGNCRSAMVGDSRRRGDWPGPNRAAGDRAIGSVEVVEPIQRYAAGEAVDFSDLSVDSGDCDRVPDPRSKGLQKNTLWPDLTYGDLAAAAGAPGAARAVGNCMARQPRSADYSLSSRRAGGWRYRALLGRRRKCHEASACWRWRPPSRGSIIRPASCTSLLRRHFSGRLDKRGTARLQKSSVTQPSGVCQLQSE